MEWVFTILGYKIVTEGCLHAPPILVHRLINNGNNGKCQQHLIFEFGLLANYKVVALKVNVATQLESSQLDI